MQVVPIYESSIIIHNVLYGGIVLGEFQQLDPAKLIFFFIGIGITVLGILILLVKKKENAIKYHRGKKSYIIEHESFSSVGEALIQGQKETSSIRFKADALSDN